MNDVEESVHELGDVRSLLTALFDRLVGEDRLQIERQTTGSSRQAQLVAIEIVLLDHLHAVFDPLQVRTRHNDEISAVVP